MVSIHNLPVKKFATLECRCSDVKVKIIASSLMDMHGKDQNLAILKMRTRMIAHEK